MSHQSVYYIPYAVSAGWPPEQRSCPWRRSFEEARVSSKLQIRTVSGSRERDMKNPGAIFIASSLNSMQGLP